ncbi:hypothetical protein GCM10023321_81180 [Pseudonocardia eucalypti]|uniref:Secreted protein n=1 Tax=Pseudonocardia eucalypti TaxID=648755 RepID=A0ABP9RDU4_9PSEU
MASGCSPALATGAWCAMPVSMAGNIPGSGACSFSTVTVTTKTFANQILAWRFTVCHLVAGTSSAAAGIE